MSPTCWGRYAAALKSIRDIERAAGRLSQASGNARDLVALKNSLQQIPELKAELGKLIERINFGRTVLRRGRRVACNIFSGAAGTAATTAHPTNR